MNLKLNGTQKKSNDASMVFFKEETLKAVYTVLVTSLVYKCLHKNQDIRLHQAMPKNDYVGLMQNTTSLYGNKSNFLAALGRNRGG